MLEWFHELRRGCPLNGFAPPSLVWSEIRAWRKERRIKLSDWALKMLWLLNDIYLAEHIKKKDAVTVSDGSGSPSAT